MKEKDLNIKGINIHYYDTEKTEAKDTIVFLPFGEYSGEFISEVSDKIADRYRIISLDYPGRRSSGVIEDNNSIETLAEYVFGFIKGLDIKRPILIGASFGTAIANEILYKHDDLELKKLILIAPGEFFSLWKKQLIKMLFLPASFSEKLRRFYRFIITRFIFSMPELYRSDLRSINQQWISIIDYKLKTDKKIDVETHIINLKKDPIINVKSRQKIQEIYPNHKIHEIDCEHGMGVSHLANKVAKIVIPTIQKIL